MWPSVIKEPIVREAYPASNYVSLRRDIGVRGVWLPQTEAFGVASLILTPCSETVIYVTTRLSFAILRSVSLCL